MSIEHQILAPGGESVRPPSHTPSAWQVALREAIRDPWQLAELLDLPADWCRQHFDETPEFRLLVPRSFLARMALGDPRDPLLQQVLATQAEQSSPEGFASDPVGDGPATLLPGLLQKYAGRVLLVATGVCAVHCRYCFRRHFPYAEASLSPAAVDAVIEHLAADDSIHEVILSGGDPLSLADGRLAELCGRLAEIPHLRRLRWHTRWPIVIPERVTSELVAVLADWPGACVVVLHANHANELAGDVPAAVARLKQSGATLLNQAVLLGGVNDSVPAQRKLSERLVDCGVVPYYLHQLDRVAGAAHFAVPQRVGEEIVAELRRQLPGYMVPRFVCEQAGAPHKTVIL
jgi:EF-P beta-lysylation protein EpmB